MNGFEYEFKHWPELVRSLVIAILTALTGGLSGLDPAGVADWRVWLAGVAVGASHAATVALLAFVTTAQQADHAPEPTPLPPPMGPPPTGAA